MLVSYGSSENAHRRNDGMEREGLVAWGIRGFLACLESASVLRQWRATQVFYERRDLIKWGSRKSMPAEWMAGCHLVAGDAHGGPAESPGRNSGSLN